jgi:hypothetical protein
MRAIMVGLVRGFVYGIMVLVVRGLTYRQCSRLGHRLLQWHSGLSDLLRQRRSLGLPSW